MQTIPVVKNDKKILFLILNTWSNDSNGIFDYSSTAIKKIKAFIPESTYVVRTKNNLFNNIEQHADIQTKDGDDLLFYVNNSKNDTYILMNPIPKNLKLKEDNLEYLNNKMWYVLRTINPDSADNNNNDCNEEYYLNENDIIKIGRMKYNVNKIYIKSRDNNNSNEAEPPMPVAKINYDISELNKKNNKPVFEFDYLVKNENYSEYIDINEKNSTGQIKTDDKCRYEEYLEKEYINQETDDGENFLIRLCKCEKKVHFKCLKSYIKQNQAKREIEGGTYDENWIFKSFGCSDCNRQFPTKFKLENQNKIFNLIDIKEPEESDCDYMILETLDYKQNDDYCKSIHIIKFTKDVITIGRENDNDVIDTDISISRHHALLKLKDGKICIQNISQKFGTLVLIKDKINILDKKIYLQVGRTYIEACLMDKKEFDEKIKEPKNEN